MVYLLARSDASRIPLPDRSVDLVLGSPPYCDARSYGIGAQRDCREWVEWMLGVTTEALRVARNCIVWVASGVTRDRTYWPACEGLMWRWWEAGGSLYRPCYWHRVGIPGSGGNDWFRADVEYCMCFKRPGPLEWSDNTAMGHPPKWAPGGEMSHRVADGDRRNQWGGHVNKRTSRRREDGTFQKAFRPSHRTHTKARADGTMEIQDYVPPALANPGNVIKTSVGGGQIGHALAHENEAPYPEALAEFFVRSLCKPGGIVLDPFSGSGTTVSVAEQTGRVGLGFDIRQSQAEIAARRIERPHAPARKVDRPMPLFAAMGGGEE